MLILILGAILAFNLIIIYWKFRINRTGDAMLDIIALALLASYFSGSTQSLTVATVASAIISLFLLFFHKSKAKA